jgi:hypothetical protein
MARSMVVRAGIAVRRELDKTVVRVQERGRSALVRAARLTGAAVAAYLVAEWVGLNEQPPLIAALTALIVVQVTLTGTVVNGFQRVLSVVAGVVLALAFASFVGLTWWSLGLLIAASIVVGQLLRLGPQLIEVPISAMLVLGVGFTASAESAAAGRAIETLVGTLVGVLVNLVIPPAVQNRYAGEAIQKLADEIASLLETSAVEIPRGLTPEAAARWLEDARRLNRHVPRVDRALAHAEESRQLNIRALASRDRGVGLRDGLDALEHCSVTVRSLFRSFHDAALADAAAGPDAEVDVGHRQELRRAQADLVRELAIAIRAFGRLLGAEMEARDPQREELALGDALRALRTRRDEAADLLLVNPRERPSEWDLNGDLMQAVERLLAELDVAEHAKAREEVRKAKAAARQRRATAALIRLRHGDDHEGPGIGSG